MVRLTTARGCRIMGQRVGNEVEILDEILVGLARKDGTIRGDEMIGAFLAEIIEGTDGERLLDLGIEPVDDETLQPNFECDDRIVAHAPGGRVVKLAHD